MAAEKVLVFDACAIIALLDAEEGAITVERLLQDPTHRCVVHAINLCEVYYHLLRSTGQERADQLELALEQYGFIVSSSLSADLWKAAGQLKASWRRVSLADCFALALAIRSGGALVTSDHHEIDRLAEAGVCKVEFIR